LHSSPEREAGGHPEAPATAQSGGSSLTALAGLSGGDTQLSPSPGDSPTPGPESTTPTAAPTATGQSRTSAASAPETEVSDASEISAYPGQCLLNLGTTEDPVFLIATCGSSTWLIVARVEQHISTEAQADRVCSNTGIAYTDYHYSDWEDEPDVPDIVFCLKSA
ncbi:MAG: hypothetical protein HKP61_15810, partial [Dactylosporangium sp.]|nr:hypothetical protein [Dactylosporangium sp.]NNJ62371.1 hypothetical protein [Dactylosporangium sp.]